MFGNHLNIPDLAVTIIDSGADNHQIWTPKSSCTRISSIVYHHINSQISPSDCWIGWQILWHIPIAPRVKHFIWICLRGRLSTYAFLHSIHVSPDNPCIFCGIHRETTDHLLCHCSRIHAVWDQLSAREIFLLLSMMAFLLVIGSSGSGALCIAQPLLLPVLGLYGYAGVMLSSRVSIQIFR